MAFVELEPVGKKAGTGVRVGHNERGGFVVSLSGDALAALGAGEMVRILLDPDPVVPRLRVVGAKDGRFRLGRPPSGDRVRLLRIGHRPEFKGAEWFKSADCTWEPADGGKGIEIDLPRELRSTSTSMKPVGTGVTSTSQPRQVAVTLPASRVKERL